MKGQGSGEPEEEGGTGQNPSSVWDAQDLQQVSGQSDPRTPPLTSTTQVHTLGAGPRMSLAVALMGVEGSSTTPCTLVATLVLMAHVCAPASSKASPLGYLMDSSNAHRLPRCL